MPQLFAILIRREKIEQGAGRIFMEDSQLASQMPMHQGVRLWHQGCKQNHMLEW